MYLIAEAVDGMPSFYDVDAVARVWDGTDASEEPLDLTMEGAIAQGVALVGLAAAVAVSAF